MTRIIDFRYREYIASDEWKAKRKERLELDGHECTNCEATTYLEVHHLTYERMGNELMSDLTTLCQTCHARLHGRGPKVLPIKGDMTPKQRQELSDEIRLANFLSAARQLEQAVKAYRTYANSMSYHDHDVILEHIEWLAGDVFEDIQRRLRALEEYHASRRRRRKAAA